MVQGKVSIIVPVYNVEKYLEFCIKSLQKQTYTDLDIILVDDGSTDHSSVICDAYAEQDNRITVIHQKNMGLPGARNAGLKKAAGKWVLFIDSDDWIAYDTVECLLVAMSENMDFLMFDYVRTNEEKEVIQAEGDGKIIKLNKENLLLVLQDVISPSHKHYPAIKANCVVATNKLYSYKFLVKYNLIFDEDVKIHEDVSFSTKVFMYAEQGAYIDKSFYQYRYNIESIMTQYKENYFVRIQPLIEKMRELLLTDFPDKLLGQKLYDERICILIAQCMERYFCNPNNKALYRERKAKWKDLLSDSSLSDSIRRAKLREFTIKKRVIIFCIKMKIFWLPDKYFHLNAKR